MKISIVIPVYNEAAQLDACLTAISHQHSHPFEVIVVNNNSDDDSAAVARRYPFVKLMHEPRQGVIHARTTGFNAARGDIIARIDADTILPPRWLEQVKHIFVDESIAAVSGAPDYYDFALPAIANHLDHLVRRTLARKLGDNNFLYGANMAVRRSAWNAVKSQLCSQGDMHEDFDLAIHLQAAGYLVIYDERLIASVSCRRIDASLTAYMRYTLISPRTYALHNLASRRHMYPVVMFCWLTYTPAHLLNRAYDPATARFSWSQLLNSNTARIDPTANVA